MNKMNNNNKKITYCIHSMYTEVIDRIYRLFSNWFITKTLETFTNTL